MLNVPQRAAPAPATAVSKQDRRRILDLSAERAAWRRRVAAMFTAGYRAGQAAAWHDAFEAGYAAAGRDDWQIRHTAVERILHPGRDIDRRVQAAESHAARESAGHWRQFTAAAYAAPERARTDVQRAVVRAGLSGGTR